MSITCIRRRKIDIYRKSSILFGPAVIPGSASLDVQPGEPVYIEVQLESGTPADVTVSGLVAGVPSVEVIPFTVEGMKRTCAEFESITSVATAATSIVTVRGVGDDGSRCELNSVVVAGQIAHKQWGRPQWMRDQVGVNGTQNFWYGIDWTSAYKPRRGDVVHDLTDDSHYEIKGVETLYGSHRTRPHHWEISLKEAKGIL